MHMTPEELQKRLRSTRELPAGSSRRIQAHREIAAECPAFVPNLLSLNRSLLLAPDDTDAQGAFTEGERTLREAAEVSGEDASALIELAHFLDVVRDSPSEAELLFAEAARRASKLLEEAWAGWIDVLGQQEKTDAARVLASRARQVFPDSELIAQAATLAHPSEER